MSNIPDNIKKMWEAAAMKKKMPLEREPALERKPALPSSREEYAAKHGKGGTANNLETKNPALYKKNLDAYKR